MGKHADGQEELVCEINEAQAHEKISKEGEMEEENWRGAERLGHPSEKANNRLERKRRGGG